MAEYVDPGNFIQYGFLNPYKQQCYQKQLSEFYKAIKVPNSLKLLDYGCGPTISDKISAAPKVSEIVLAEYTEPNRAYVQKWLDKDSAAFDWSPSFKHVVQTLEGGTEEEAESRRDEVRRKVKAVVSCDITKDQFIAKGYEGPYNIIQCSLCLESAYRDLDSYRGGIRKLASLLNKGGSLLLYSTLRENSEEGFYTVNGKKVPDLALKKDFILRALKDNGFTVVYTEQFEVTPSELSNTEAFVFINACLK